MADRAMRLQERLTTAVELKQGKILSTPTMQREQLADARATAERVDVTISVPLTLDRRDWLVISLATLLIAMAILLPNPQGEMLKKRQAVAESIKEQVEALEALKEAISDNPALSSDQQERLLDPVEEALQELEQSDLSQEGAMAALSESEAELRSLSEEFSTERLRQALRDAGQPLADNLNSQALGESLQNGDFSAAGAATAQLADELDPLSADELATLAEDLAATAAALEGIDDELAAELGQAARALREGDLNAAMQALRDASGTLQQRAQETAAAQQAQAAAGQLSQGRQQIAQAGSSDASQDQGQSQTQGQGQGSAGATGNGQGQGLGQGIQTDQGQGTGGPGPGGGHAETIFVPEYTDLSTEAGVDVELPAECVSNPANCGGLLNETPAEFGNETSGVPYSQVFGDYRNAAYEALADDYIPLGLKGYVRDYFTSLEP